MIRMVTEYFSILCWKEKPGHNDSMVRTMSVINEITGSGYLVEKLSDEIANWNRDQAANKMKQFLGAVRKQDRGSACQ